MAMPIAESRKTQEMLVQQAQQQISTVPEETRHIQRKILLDTREQIEQPSVRPASPLAARVFPSPMSLINTFHS